MKKEIEIFVREASREDIPAIAHVAATSYIDAFGEHFLNKKNLEEETKERRSEKYFESVYGIDTILVALVQKQLVGYIQFGAMSLTFDTFTDKDLECRRLYILTEFQSLGIGKTLMKSMLDHERLNNVENVYIEVWENNPKALNLYKSFGFEDTGNRRPFYEDGKQVGEDSIFKLTLR